IFLLQERTDVPCNHRANLFVPRTFLRKTISDISPPGHGPLSPDGSEGTLYARRTSPNPGFFTDNLLYFMAFLIFLCRFPLFLSQGFQGVTTRSERGAPHGVPPTDRFPRHAEPGRSGLDGRGVAVYYFQNSFMDDPAGFRRRMTSSYVRKSSPRHRLIRTLSAFAATILILSSAVQSG